MVLNFIIAFVFVYFYIVALVVRPHSRKNTLAMIEYKKDCEKCKADLRFIIPDSNDINGFPILLDCNQQEIE